MARVRGFEGLEDELERIAEEFREEQKTGLGAESGQIESTRAAIRSGVREVMQDVVRRAQMDAQDHVPRDDATTIQHQSLGFDENDNYTHRYYSNSDLVAYHEFGTGTRAEHPSYRGTVNASEDGKRGYLIEPGPDKEALMWEEDGFKVFAEYVIHPGVAANHFMEQALRRNMGRFEQSISRKMDERFSNLESFR